ncbi:RNA polymerase sigma-70 factor, ECF subfamily [Methylobacterium sp. 174MFSha1.1]|uniref:sigma-70 family RNA polymerase sigma factor n=1 Tax=Methylobacterium sp. 174MFSha1.1 TaxID=1502749 RepID=UPI0008DF3DFC|nr:sigma-70 family RNA polymerase sigma factor [Methylobacterium sp. 174MFSha1.1]SFV14780.1 RNA polymerase sigma-70 factor, ECF subfamily [Methylobacterium sp. 174MFSha1.1]
MAPPHTDPDRTDPTHSPSLPAGIQAHLGAALRAAYDDAALPLGPELQALVARLAEALAGLDTGAAEAFRRDLVGEVPRLRRRAVTLCNDRTRADDLVQETLLKAWAAQDRFVPGTHLSAWLYTILRNSFYSEHQKRAREVGDPDGLFAASLVSLPAQQGTLDLHDLQAALDRLVPDQREALLLSAVHDLSYEDIATAMECRVGTVKSRINRARARLAELLG